MVIRNLRERELDWCLQLNGHLEQKWLRWLMSTASRLGDGWLWVALILGFFAAGMTRVGLQMTFAGVLSTLCYGLLKHLLGRRRPCDCRDDFDLPVAPLDQWSFPSGHTMHAVVFTVIGSAYVPALALVLVPFAALVMASRVVLGLHYPTDVLAGGGCGVLVALLAMSVI